jgi:heat-inducible transcriptional repressor
MSDNKMTDVSMPGSPALDRRKAAILEAIVTEYIGTATPVGSQHVAQSPGVNVSSATVRSEMAALEHEGYVIQPHTSAGRIPTDKGYRFFVDHLATPGVLGPSQRHKVSRFFEQVHGELEQLLHHATGLLADLTSCAAVVVGPSRDNASIRSVQLVSLSPRVALLLVVLSDGAVEKRTLEWDFDVSVEVLNSASLRLAEAAFGQTITERFLIAPSGDPIVDALLIHALDALASMGEPEPDRVFVGRPSQLAVAFDAVETVRSVLSTLEQQIVVVTLLRDVLDRGLSVAIGTEHGYEPLSSCAVVVAPVSVDGHDAGAIGLFGPTRMNYPQALAAAHVVGERLGQRIGEQLSIGEVTPLSKTPREGTPRGR